MLEEFAELVTDGELDDAGDLLAQLVARSPNHVDVIGAELSLAAALKDAAGTLHAGQRYLARRPDDSELTFSLVGMALSEAQTLLATQLAQEAVRRWPDHPQAQKTRQLLALLAEGAAASRRDFLAAHPTLDAAAADAVQSCQEQYALLVATERVAEATALCERTLDRYPGLATVTNNLSSCHWQAGRFEDAWATCSRVLAADPDNTHALAKHGNRQPSPGAVGRAAGVGAGAGGRGPRPDGSGQRTGDGRPAGHRHGPHVAARRMDRRHVPQAGSLLGAGPVRPAVTRGRIAAGARDAGN
ncbi:MAG: tetratricopeptide repeat protein [Deltaproteobacteria bacterium]|nr:tetratricopeptide repeat protein [Deltaproteobacteria bacterium]